MEATLHGGFFVMLEASFYGGYFVWGLLCTEATCYFVWGLLCTEATSYFVWRLLCNVRGFFVNWGYFVSMYFEQGLLATLYRATL